METEDTVEKALGTFVMKKDEKKKKDENTYSQTSEEINRAHTSKP